jgi:hypothetical protein
MKNVYDEYYQKIEWHKTYNIFVDNIPKYTNMWYWNYCNNMPIKFMFEQTWNPWEW